MNIQLINTPNPRLGTTEQIFFNRGIDSKELKHYVNLTKTDINEPEGLGKSALTAGAMAIVKTVNENASAIVIVDCDCDGYTSGALIINYLHRIFPTWVENKLHWSLHTGKTHGLSDQMAMLTENHYDLIICPDSSSNDYEYHQTLKEQGSTILILDHHLADHISNDAIVINNQLSKYPNKELSGVGVAWQFCRFLDKLLNANYADDLLDLVAIGNCGDMMSLKSFETRYLIFKGLEKNHIKNPFLEYIIDKNNFPLTTRPDYKSYYPEQACTSVGAAFFIVPFINAITRSGSIDEKELIFKSMLDHYAFTRIPEIKRNKMTGKEEYLVLQAVRVIGNVKNRQSRAEENSLAKLEKKIEKDYMLNHRVLLFLLQPNEIEPEIRGLIANKFMAKYQRPCIILTHTSSDNQKESYEGSMRGYTKNGLTSFKKLLEKCPGVMYVEGHDNAAGLGIEANQAEAFLNEVDRLMENVSADPIYRVDYYFKDACKENTQKIIDIATLNDYWGQDMDRAYIAIKFKVTESNFKIMKSNTLKIELENGLSLIKFSGTEEDIYNFTTQGWKEIEAYCKCNINEWNGTIYPQLIIEDYEVIDSCSYIF